MIFVVGSAFHVDGSGHNTIRLSFSAPSPERIEEGARRLAEPSARSQLQLPSSNSQCYEVSVFGNWESVDWEFGARKALC